MGVGFWFARERDRLGSRTLFNVKPGEAGLNGWVKITRDNSVIVAVPRAEMGQGVHTALAMLVAEEMDARWDQVRVEDPPENVVYRNVEILIDGLPFSPEETGTVVDIAHWVAGKLGGVLGVLATGGSTATRDAWLPMRIAGAVARDLLLRAASRKAAVPVGELIVVRGRGPPQGRQPRGHASASWSTLSAISRSMPAPPLKQPSAVQADRQAAAAPRHPGQGDGRGDLRHRRAPARPALCRGAQCADLRRRGERLHGEGQPAQGRRDGGHRAGRHRRHRRELVARQQASQGRHRRAVAGRAPNPSLDSATLWKRYEELMEDGKPA